MGALTSNRKRKDECFKLNAPSPPLNSSYYNHYCCGDRFGNHRAKKPRISYSESPRKGIVTPKSVAPRLSTYPEPEKLRREVHAPCRSSRFGFRIREKAAQMGNILATNYNRAKESAFNTLRFIKFEKKNEVIDLEVEPRRYSGVVEIIEDGNDVRSVVSEENRVVESDGCEFDIQKLDGKSVERDGIRDSSMMSNMVKVEGTHGLFGSVPLDREAYKDLLSIAQRRDIQQSNLDFEIISTVAQLQSLQLEKLKEDKKLTEFEEPRKDLVLEPFVPLTEEEEREVARALSNSNRRKILVTHENSNIDITGEILQCLRPSAWLNDEVINVYLELLKEREIREPKKFLKCHFFNTFFYKKLISERNGYDYKAVRRWTTQRKLGYGLVDCEKIFVPIHKEVHWCLAVINKRDKVLQYLDSLGGRDYRVLSVLAKYFMDEVKDKTGQEIDVSSWDHEFVEGLPKQQNGFDCGVFMIKYADFYSRGLGLHFSQENMPYFRVRTAKEILRLRAD